MNRRRFVKTTAALGASVVPIKLLAGDTDKVDPAEPQAAALGYVHNAAEVDAATFPRFEASQNCFNCQLYQGAADDEWAGCAIFANRKVAGAGWCNAWIPRTG